MEAFREFKRIWDPDGRMNPGKLIGDLRLDEDLRLGAEHRPPQLKTHFAFPDDGGSFAGAGERCFGMAKCRVLGGQTMCPSFQVTREERHTTRGRARLLFEMLKGDVVADGWRDEAVKESLDLCLSCKGCKSECPVHVDLATYKAEFLSHYYARRLRPRSAYALGLIPLWARVASRAPRLVNVLTHAPASGALAKRAAGIAPERPLPRFATHTFRSWFSRHQPANPDGPRVVLWADTFNDHFHPDTARAALAVLEAGGYRVELQPRGLCCGRPLYDYGMLALAKRFLRRILDAMHAELTGGLPIVVLEPSCAAVFRDELRNLLPGDEHARRLTAQTLLLSELLDREPDRFDLRRVERRALVHGHCHHKAVLGLDAEKHVLDRLGLDWELLDSGCCGMAGSFGYEAGERYRVSIAAGERVLLPAVRRASADTLIVTDGFSCRQQIADRTGRHALHLADAVRLALPTAGT